MLRWSGLQIAFFAVLVISFFSFVPAVNQNENILSYTVNPKIQDLKLYWKDDKGQLFRSIQNLKTWLEAKSKKLLFAMNGGMYMKDNAPLGLYIENFITKRKLDTASGKGNFYIKPNGVFYIIDDDEPFICTTHDFKNTGKIKYATQSGPMLLVNGEINTEFKSGSKNLNIRNGVGILPNNKVVFAISKTEINFYDFANYFKTLGCKNALYLDGFVSRMYLPEEKWMQTDGDFGVLIGVTEN